MHDRPADFGRAGEGDLLDVGVRGDRRAGGVAVAVHQVDDALGHPGLGQDVVQHQRRKWGLLGGFDHAAAARRQRRRELGAEVEDRAVPREDQPDDAVGLPQGVGVQVRVDAGQAAGVDVARDAVDLGAPAGVVAEPLGADLGDDLRLRRRDAGVERFELGEDLGVLVDQLADPPQHLGPVVVGQSRPDTGLGGRLRPRNGVVDGFGPQSVNSVICSSVAGSMIGITSPVPGRSRMSSSTSCTVMAVLRLVATLSL